MELLIRQRVFSWTDTYDVYDGNQQPRYFVRAEFLTLGHQIHVFSSATGQEVGTIRQRLLTFLPKFEIACQGRELGSVEKRFTLFRPRYDVAYRGWTVDGDFLGWDYEVRDGARMVMHIAKEPFHWGDTYVLHYDKPEDELPGLLLVIAIDAANCSGN